MDLGDQPMAVVANIEHDALSNGISVWELALDVQETLPFDALADLTPCGQRP
jgi:hypothetical protein